MRLLKIGTLNMPRDRWEDALDVFEDIDVFCFDTEVELKNEHIHYLKFNTNNRFNSFLFRAAKHFNFCKDKILLCNICLFFLRLLNTPLLKKFKNKNYDAIHSSYNDFDESAFLTLLLNPKSYIRAQKETRLHFSYFEKWAFQHASRIVLNDPLNLELFEKKYGRGFLENKPILYGLDEDARTRRLEKYIQHDKKLSEEDGKVHSVILAGRVLSNPNELRSGGRLYYINLIKDLIRAGVVVHLHTANIVPFEGDNPYEKLAEENAYFFIENKLDFSEDAMNAYRILSRYDIGICHAHLPNSEVSEFDKVNIPHRYYEYHLAHVVPIDLSGENLLLEKKAEEGHALIYSSYTDVTLDRITDIQWDIPTFSEYIKYLYSSDKDE